MSSPANETEHAPGAPLLSRISELLVAGSLEISPRELHRTENLGALLPTGTCVYIPSLPGLPLARTLEAVRAIREAGLDPVPHVSARRILDRAEFENFIKQAVQRYGVHRVLLLGGDEPKPKGPFADSIEVLQTGLLADSGIREIGVSGYPEGHPRISNLAEAFAKKLELASKQRLGVYVVTQFSFSPNRIVEFCSRLARSAPNVSVYVGVAGPTDPVALARYAQRCGVSVSLRALRTLGSGIAQLVTNSDPREQITAIARYTLHREPSNVVGVHIYSFGGVVKTAAWMRELM
ncbi:MAG TPA: methylenetetrahydrofolate reductase [Burkholderiales bacterium]|nr:methylenetetrahydrofolate reductase [Burkholderiales bacterium]